MITDYQKLLAGCAATIYSGWISKLCNLNQTTWSVDQAKKILKECGIEEET